MNITDEALQALISKAYEQGYEMGYGIGRCEKNINTGDDIEDVTYGDIYEEFKKIYPNLAQEVENYRPYQRPYVSEDKPYNILLYIKTGDMLRYDYITKKSYFVNKEEREVLNETSNKERYTMARTIKICLDTLKDTLNKKI